LSLGANAGIYAPAIGFEATTASSRSYTASQLPLVIRQRGNCGHLMSTTVTTVACNPRTIYRRVTAEIEIEKFNHIRLYYQKKLVALQPLLL